VLVDQDMDKMLNIVFQLAMSNPTFEQELASHGLLSKVGEFRDIMMNGVNKVMWCNHKGCEGGQCDHKDPQHD